MKQQELLLLLALLAMSRRAKGSKPWAPMGPFEADDTLPSQPVIPPNPLGKP